MRSYASLSACLCKPVMSPLTQHALPTPLNPSYLIIDAIPLRLHRPRVCARHHTVAQVAGPQHSPLLQAQCQARTASGLVACATREARLHKG